MCVCKYKFVYACVYPNVDLHMRVCVCTNVLL